MKRICILVVSYNAADLLLKTLDRIPREVVDQVEEILVYDDASHDASYDAALAYKQRHGVDKLKVLRNRENRGYGGNQKRGYQYCLARGFDVVVLLHGDGQYAPEILPQLLAPVLAGEADMVMGSRMAAGCDPLGGGMPRYKYYGNRIASGIQRELSGMTLTEFHSGYRAYSCHALRRIPLVQNTDNWHFDTQILLELSARRFRIREIPIPTFYGDEISRVNGVPYVAHCVWECIKFRSTRGGLWRSILYDNAAPADYQMKDHLGSSHNTMLGLLAPAAKGSRILDVGSAGGYMDRALQAEGHAVTAIEIDPVSAEQARPYCAEILVGDVEALDLGAWAGYFDYVLLGDVLEHLKDPEAALQKVLQTLKPGGKVVACVPNVANLYVRLKLLAGRFDYEPKGIMDAGHLRFYTMHSFRALLQRAGLEIQDLHVTPLPLPLVYPRLVGRGWFRLVHRALYALTRRLRKLLAYQFIVVAEKSSWLAHIHQESGGSQPPAVEAAAGR